MSWSPGMPPPPDRGYRSPDRGPRPTTHRPAGSPGPRRPAPPGYDPYSQDTDHIDPREPYRGAGAGSGHDYRGRYERPRTEPSRAEPSRPAPSSPDESDAYGHPSDERRTRSASSPVRYLPVVIVAAVIVGLLLLLTAGGITFSWVDYLVLGLALVAGVSGWRHGMAVALLSFVGVLGGAIIGVRLAPALASGIDSDNARIVVSIVVVVLLVALGETTGVFFGRRIRDRITSRRSLRIDSSLGSVLQAITVIIASWLVALPLASASFPGLAAGVRGSEVLQVVDGVMPAGARALPDELRQLLDNSGFPQILDPFSETPITEVAAPDPALARSPIVTEVADSVLKVRGRAPSCQRQLEGTGFVIGDGLVMTNAHVVAGTTDTGVEVENSRGRIIELDAQVVLYDPAVDIAVLSVPELDAPALPFRPRPADPGESSIVLGYPLDGPFTATSGVIRQRITLQGPDIYDSGQVSRDVYTVRAVVRSGNSGGPMIDTDGQVIGVVFGAALDDSETGFVLTNEQVATTVNPQAQLSAEVSTGPCAN